jgi:hypothetical protein
VFEADATDEIEADFLTCRFLVSIIYNIQCVSVTARRIRFDKASCLTRPYLREQIDAVVKENQSSHVVL